jgi:hypothetical protein
LKNKFSWSSSNKSSSKDSLKSSSSSNSLNEKSNKSNLQAQQEEPKKIDFVPITGSDREKEMGRNLDEISIGLGNLKSLAMSMNSELTRQEPVIDRLTCKTDKTHSRINAQQKEMNKILKN